MTLLPIHVIAVNIFISWFCEVTIPKTTRISVSQKWKWGDESLGKWLSSSFRVPWENISVPSFVYCAAALLN